jgi:adenylate cyclase
MQPAEADPDDQPIWNTDPDVDKFVCFMASRGPRTLFRVFSHLPSNPRCRICNAPFKGFGRVLKTTGFGPSRKNPNLCNRCFELSPLGGAEMEVGILFADVRGFTTLSESIAPREATRLLNRFYEAASDVLCHRLALIDKLAGDEVMALFLPAFVGRDYRESMVESAEAILRAIGYGSDDGPWLQIGVGLDAGTAFVGNVGTGDVKDFTAIGDVVNTAARLQSHAGGGEIVMGESVYQAVRRRYPAAPAAALELKGKSAPYQVRRVGIK